MSCGFHEAARGVLSHHMVIREGKIANYQPYPPTPWNASPRDTYGTPGPYEDAVQNTPIFEENGPENFKGIDIMRAVRSFDPCLPCGVHMYTGGGRGAQGDAHADRVRLMASRAAEPQRRPSCSRASRSSRRGSSSSPDPRARGAGRGARLGGDRDVRRRAGADHGRDPRLARGGRDDPGRALAGRRGRQPAADPRPLPGRTGASGCWRRSRRCGPTWSPTAATSSCARLPTTAWRGSRCRAAVTAARRRARRWRRRSTRRSRSTARISPGSRSSGVLDDPTERRRLGDHRRWHCRWPTAELARAAAGLGDRAGVPAGDSSRVAPPFR